MSSASRRRFLTGGVALDALRAQGEQLADVLTANAAALPHSGDTVRLETRAMACPWAVILDPGPAEQVLTASDALQEVHRIEALLSVYRPDSDISRLNARATEDAQAVTPELFELLQRCASLYEETSGAFDPATQALIALWRDARLADRVPTQPEIDAAVGQCGMASVQLESKPSPEGPSNRVRFAAPGVGLNFGAIGKGYAIDRASAILRRGGVGDFLVHGGHSSLFAAGQHVGQGGWPVGLKNPLFTEQSYLLLLLNDQALGTSGSNIQFFRHAGRRYGHILDPRTGWPAEGLLSVSVIAPTAAEADALSTAFYVLGLEKALEYCDTHSSVGAILTPPAERGRRLSPIVCNLPAERLYPVSDDVELRFAGGT